MYKYFVAKVDIGHKRCRFYRIKNTCVEYGCLPEIYLKYELYITKKRILPKTIAEAIDWRVGNTPIPHIKMYCAQLSYGKNQLLKFIQ